MHLSYGVCRLRAHVQLNTLSSLLKMIVTLTTIPHTCILDNFRTFNLVGENILTCDGYLPKSSLSISIERSSSTVKVHFSHNLRQSYLCWQNDKCQENIFYWKSWLFMLLLYCHTRDGQGITWPRNGLSLQQLHVGTTIHVQLPESWFSKVWITKL